MHARSLTIGLLGAVVGMAGLTTFTTLRAQSAPAPAAPTRVACIDVVKVYNEYQRQIDLTTEMSDVDKRLKDENEAHVKQIQTLQDAIAVMDPKDPTFRDQQEKLLKLQISYKNWTDMMQAYVRRELSMWTGRMYQEIMEQTEKAAKDRGYDLVLYYDGPFQELPDNPDAVREQIRNRKTLYVAPQLDVTTAVLEQLNAKYKAAPPGKMLKINPTAMP
jgi:Skp family chaperone for outer membrane proteins